MELILIILLLVLVLGIFVIYPIILFFQCLFDSSVTAPTKILVFISSLFVFPIPSFCYGAFIKGSGLSKFILGLYVVLFLIVVTFMIFFGGAAIVAGYMGSEGMGFEQMMESQIEAPAPEKSIEESYKGYNTYETDEVNVFESSGTDEPEQAPEQAPEAAPSQAR